MGARMKPKPKARGKKAGGRPSLYRREHNRQAYHLALLGATDIDLARAFGVDERTINRWKRDQKGFCQSLKRGKDQADARVAHSLFRRARGYSHKAVKILTVADGIDQGSHVEKVDYIERYPPDTTAAIFWLKNRRPREWRDRHEMAHSGGVTLDQIIADSYKVEP